MRKHAKVDLVTVIAVRPGLDYVPAKRAGDEEGGYVLTRSRTPTPKPSTHFRDVGPASVRVRPDGRGKDSLVPILEVLEVTTNPRTGSIKGTKPPIPKLGLFLRLTETIVRTGSDGTEDLRTLPSVILEGTERDISVSAV